MYSIGIDLHKRNLVTHVLDANGECACTRQFASQETTDIQRFFRRYQPFEAVIEASCSFRWLYELLAKEGKVIVAHPLRLRAIVAGRAKTDKLDAALLAQLLRGKWIPQAYVPERPYFELRQITRARARLSQRFTEAKNEMHALLMQQNVHLPYSNVAGVKAQALLRKIDFGFAGNLHRDELLARFSHYKSQLVCLDEQLEHIAKQFPQTESLIDIRGIGLFTALLIIAEIGDPTRFRSGRQVGTYAGLTPRVNQSGGHCYHGNITKQGSPWLRWVLIQVAMKVLPGDPMLINFYQRVRKRSSAKIARVAVARKLAEICWVRLMRWHRQQNAQAA